MQQNQHSQFIIKLTETRVGDPTAQQWIREAFSHQVGHFLQDSGVDPNYSLDEIFDYAFEHISSFQGDLIYFAGYLYEIATTKLGIVLIDQSKFLSGQHHKILAMSSYFDLTNQEISEVCELDEPTIIKIARETSESTTTKNFEDIYDFENGIVASMPESKIAGIINDKAVRFKDKKILALASVMLLIAISATALISLSLLNDDDTSQTADQAETNNSDSKITITQTNSQINSQTNSENKKDSSTTSVTDDEEEDSSSSSLSPMSEQGSTNELTSDDKLKPNNEAPKSSTTTTRVSTAKDSQIQISTTRSSQIRSTATTTSRPIATTKPAITTTTQPPTTQKSPIVLVTQPAVSVSRPEKCTVRADVASSTGVSIFSSNKVFATTYYLYDENFKLVTNTNSLSSPTELSSTSLKWNSTSISLISEIHYAAASGSGQISDMTHCSRIL